MRRTKDSPSVDNLSITTDGSEITERVISGLLSNDEVYINDNLEKDLEVLRKNFPEHFSAVEQWNKDNLARNDINHFAESVIFDENGNLIKQREMDRLIQSHIDDCEKTGHYCGILAPVGAGKTVQTAVIRPLFKIWKNKNILIKIISASEDLAMKRCEHVGRIIMNNKNFQRICGDEIKPAPARHKSEESWSKARFVIDRSSGSIDGTVESYGMLSTGMGGRCHLIIFDDCIDDRSTIISPALKASVKQKFEAQWMTRPFQNAGFAIWICTRWTEDDLSSDLMNNQVWKFLEIAVSEDFEKLTYKKMHKRIVYEEGEIPLPYPFTKESLLKSYDLIGPLQFNRTFRQRPYSDSDKLFGSAEVCFRSDVSFTQSAEIVLKNKFPTYIGVDLAGTKRKGTAIVTVGLDNNKKRWLASATIGRWKAPDLLLKLASLDQKFNPRFIVVETNSYQESLIDWARNSPERYPFYHKLVSFTTTAQAKQDEKFGLRSMDIEFQNNAWVIPANADGHPNVSEHIKGCGECLIRDEIIGYPIYPTSDLVMAMWFARSVIVDNQFTNSELENNILENLPEDEFFDRMDKMDQYGFYRSER